MAWLLEKEIRRDLPEEWRGIVPSEVFMRESQEIVEKARQEGLILRVLGGLGIAIRCQEFRDFAQKLSRIGTGVIKARV